MPCVVWIGNSIREELVVSLWCFFSGVQLELLVKEKVPTKKKTQSNSFSAALFFWLSVACSWFKLESNIFKIKGELKIRKQKKHGQLESLSSAVNALRILGRMYWVSVRVFFVIIVLFTFVRLLEYGY